MNDDQKDETPAAPVEVSPGQPTDPTPDDLPTGGPENDDEDEVGEDADPSVPTDLLELHVELEDKGVSPEEFQATYGGEA